MHRDLFAYAINGMMHRQLRAWLTILGIVIGIAAIVALIAVAQGLDTSIRQQLSMLGTDYINVVPGNLEKSGLSAFAGETGVLTENDAEAIKRVPGIRLVTYALEDRVSLGYRNKNISLYGVGTEPAMMQIYTFKVGEGRMFQESERGVVVLGYTIAKDTFDEKIELNRRVSMGGREFRVIGIMEKSGGSGPMSMMDSVLYLPKDDAREIMSQYRGNRIVTEIHAGVEPSANVKEVEQAVNAEMLRSHKVSEENRDFTVITADYVQKQVDAILGLLTLFLGAVAGISLLVGAVGIANTMFMAVLERTREIGTLKAIGASRNAILEVFLIESALIGIVGGAIGVLVGTAISFIINQFGFPSAVSLQLAAFSVVFSAIVGIVSGVFPARRAAVLEPMEALRYE